MKASRWFWWFFGDEDCLNTSFVSDWKPHGLKLVSILNSLAVWSAPRIMSRKPKSHSTGDHGAYAYQHASLEPQMTKDHKNQYGSWLKSQRASNLFRFLGGLGPKFPLLTARSAERQGRFKHNGQRMNNPDNPVIKSGGTMWNHHIYTIKKVDIKSGSEFHLKKSWWKKKHQKIWRIFVDITSQPLALSCHPMQRPK